MDQQKCVKCKDTKPVDEFDWRNKAAGRRVARCKPCQRQYGKLWYSRNKQHHAKLTRDKREHHKSVIRALKEVPCADCGNSFPYYVMDFDHTKDDKVDNVSHLMREGKTAAALEETKKCEVVCSNCHRIRTHTRMSGVLEEPESSSPCHGEDRGFKSRIPRQD